MINALRKIIKTLQATADAANKREEAFTQERDNLKEEIALLRKKLFGTSSEKRTRDIRWSSIGTHSEPLYNLRFVPVEGRLCCGTAALFLYGL